MNSFVQKFAQKNKIKLFFIILIFKFTGCKTLLQPFSFSNHKNIHSKQSFKKLSLREKIKKLRKGILTFSKKAIYLQNENVK